MRWPITTWGSKLSTGYLAPSGGRGSLGIVGTSPNTLGVRSAAISDHNGEVFEVGAGTDLLLAKPVNGDA